MLRKRKAVKIVETEVCPNHIPPSISVSSFVGYLKGKKYTNDILKDMRI